MGAIINGLNYAKDGKGAEQSEKEKYLIPWNTKERAISGGAKFIGSSYINVGQNTIYLQKFDVNDERSKNLFWHQYMTNILAPYNESKSIYNGYKNSGLLNSSMSFVIPVYEDMPKIPTQNPNINSTDFINDNTLVYCDATNVNIRTGPSTSYEKITSVSNPEKMTRIGKGNQVGERWDKVILSNGIIGFIYQPYCKEVPIREIDESEIIFENSLKLNNFQISGLDYKNNTVEFLKSQIKTDLEIQIMNNKNETLDMSKIIGTGSKIQIKEDGIILREYTVILYGDANGDGKINSIDLLVLQRYILGSEDIEDIYKIACNINKNGKKPSSIDLLLIQRHILGLNIIEQSK